MASKDSPSPPPVAVAAGSGLTDEPSRSDPSTSDRHLEFLSFNNEGGLLMGSSDLCGRVWIGSAWFYSDPKDAPGGGSPSSSPSSVLECEDGVSDGLFLSPTHMILALDSGSIDSIQLGSYMERTTSITEHDDLISGLTRSPDKLITSSYDKTIVVYDISTSFALDTRLSAKDLLSDVASNPLDPFILASASCDGRVDIWDLRTNKEPSSCVYECPSSWPTALAWSPQDDSNLLIGNQSGEIGLYDTRQPKGDPLSSNTSMEKQIHKITFSPSVPDIAAVAADTYTLRIFNVDGLKVLYEDERHQDFVRGLAWHPKKRDLWTCGWDRLVISHSLDLQENNNA
uniref:Methylosome protein 50 n=1 Tax=Caligus clemensi TaxID=344056 RepID=C1C0Y6_CALCM|nr:Methylosome protein 50 [Caligus clemensi]